jgi:hypothetical protein
MHRALSRTILAAVAATALAGACATERDPIDRTQPNGLRKDLFQGEWYYQQTVIEIPGTWSFTFVGETNWLGMERVRWEIQEDWLYARRAYERIKDAEGAGAVAEADPNAPPYLGAILAAYRIQSHFDIRRAYNSTTGEEYNVIEENTVDRPWYDRDYFRVDWSKNYATEFMFLVDDVVQDPVAFYIQDPNDPDYPVFDPGVFDEQTGAMVRQPYIDVTNTVMTQPGMTYFPDIGESYPTCWLFSRATADCTTEMIKVRSSFLRVNPDRQYIPKKFKGLITDQFGLFTQDRLVYDPLREINERYRERYAQLHNVWNQWLDQNGSPLAPSNRGGIRPMIYYVHNWPDALQPSLRATETEWNTIFQRALGGAMGGAPVGDKVFVACNWPLKEGIDDPAVCVPPEYRNEDGTIDPAFNPRLGDVRYNWIAYVDRYYDGFALLGLGPSNTDPLTGEVISAGAYLYVYNDIVTQSTTDMVRLLNGDIDPTNYVNGVDLTDWVDSAPKSMQAANNRTVSPEDISRMAGAVHMDWANNLVPATHEQVEELSGRPMTEIIRRMKTPMLNAGAFNAEFDDSDGRLSQLRNTYLENLLVNPEMKAAVGIMPGSNFNSLSDDMLKRASVVRVGPIKVLDAIEQKRRYYANVKNVDLMDTADDGYWGLATKYQGHPESEIMGVIRDDVYHAVLAHELGHSFNLHHNFGGTEDVVNYKDEYWTLRDDGDVAPRWQDPISDRELEGDMDGDGTADMDGIYSYAYSSIMDYSRLTQDSHGPGKYDEAAILLGYGGVVERYKDVGSLVNRMWIFNEWAQSDGSPLYFTLPPEAFHYTEWFNGMGHAFHDASNRELVSQDNVDWETGSTDNAFPRVPYVFCTPYQSDIGNGCFTRDYGADEYERVSHHIALANTWYVTRAFTRYAVGVQPEEYVGRYYDRIYRRLKGYNDYYALIIGILRSFNAVMSEAELQAFLSDPTSGWASYTIAVHDAVNFLLSTIAMPDVNGFDVTTDPAGQTYLAVSPFITVDAQTSLTTGRYFTTTWWDTTFADTCGMYFWECLHHFGFYLDKVMALEALTDSQTYFVARDTAEDLREWRISFYDDFAPQMNAFFGGVLAQDYAQIAPHYVSFSDVRHPDYVLGDTPTAGTALDPATGFTVQLYAAVLGMARFQNNFDKTFLDSSRMWLRGSAFSVESPDGYVEYVDPRQGGKTYRAIDFPDGSGAAQRMIGRANAVLSRSHSCTSGCVTGLTEEDKNRADNEISNYANILDVMVDLTGYYETFTQGYGDPYNPGEIPGGGSTP